MESRPASLHILSVSRLTNLSVDTIRAWEKRYAAVIPVRGPSGQRRFSPDDVARLVLLKKAVDSGAPISRVAPLSMQRLQSFVQQEQRVGDADDAVISRLLRAIYAADTSLLAEQLRMAGLSRSSVEFGDDIIASLVVEIAANAHSVGESTTCELVLASTLHSISSLLHQKYEVDTGRPLIVFLTLPGEKHSIPPLVASLVAAEAGYRTFFAGTEVAPYHVQSLVQATSAKAIGIYIGVRSDDAVRLVHDLQKRIEAVRIFVGSHNARVYQGLDVSETLRSFSANLARWSLV